MVLFAFRAPHVQFRCGLGVASRGRIVQIVVRLTSGCLALVFAQLWLIDFAVT